MKRKHKRLAVLLLGGLGLAAAAALLEPWVEAT